MKVFISDDTSPALASASLSSSTAAPCDSSTCYTHFI